MQSTNEQMSVQTLYDVGNGAKVIGSIIFAASTILLIWLFMRNPREILDTFSAWRTNPVEAGVYAGGFVLLLLTLGLGLWMPLRAFIFPSVTEGTFVSTAIRETRPGRRPLLEIVIGNRTITTIYSSVLHRSLETLQRGTCVRIFSGYKSTIIRVQTLD